MARRPSLAITAACLLAACKDQPSRLDHLAHDAPVTITIDGELHEPAWNLRAVRGVFRREGSIARPWSEIRVLHDAAHVYIALYAADEDIRASDHFELRVAGRSYMLPAAGAPAFAALDVDGTLDQPSDDDEEWIVELALPRAGLPDPLPIEASRCDTPKDGKTYCAAWTGSVPLPP